MEPIPYTDENRQSILDEHLGHGDYLIEDQRHTTGYFLLFDTSPRPEPVDEFAVLKSKVAMLEAKVAMLEKAK